MILAQATQHWGDEQRTGVAILILVALLIILLGTKKR